MKAVIEVPKKSNMLGADPKTYGPANYENYIKSGKGIKGHTIIKKD